MVSQTYSAVHQRLIKKRGRASTHSCASCGGPAAEWAYDHADPDEVVGPEYHGLIVTYSMDLAHYRPLCRSCHRKEDETYSERTHCPQGHEYTEENTYVNPNTKKRYCRTCGADATRRYQQRKRF